jgi:hypothetical protein
MTEIIRQSFREQAAHPEGLNSSQTHGTLYPAGDPRNKVSLSGGEPKEIPASIDPVEEWLIKNGIPVSRETYLQMDYPEIQDWTLPLDPELESMLPDLFMPTGLIRMVVLRREGICFCLI